MSYVNFNRHYTRAELEALTTASEGKIYFATDGGIYVGNSSGTVDKKAGDDVFVATYGTTTYSEISQANASGKVVLLKYDNDTEDLVFTLSSDSYENGYHTFSALYSNADQSISHAEVRVSDQDVWSGPVYKDVESLDHKVNSISAASTNAQYPSAKAVYDAIQNAGGTFYAEYGTTTYQEVDDAYSAGKNVIAFDSGGYLYILKQTSELGDDTFRFSRTDGNSVYTLTLDITDEWSSSMMALQTQLTFDLEPTAGSVNPVTSGGIKTYSDSLSLTFNSNTNTILLKRGSTTLSSLSTDDFSISGVLTSASYQNGILTMTFTSGDVVTLDLATLLANTIESYRQQVEELESLHTALSEEDYEALATKDPDKYYYIYE